MFTEIVYAGYIFNVDLEEGEIIRAGEDEDFANQLGEKYYSLFLSGFISAERQEIPETELQNVEGVEEESETNSDDHAQASSSENRENFSWSHPATRLFITELEKLLPLLESGKVNYKKMYEKIVATLAIHGYNITSKQCATRYASLKRMYKAIKDNNSKSGAERKTWIYFDSMDKIFGSKLWMVPETVESSSTPAVLKPEDPSRTLKRKKPAQENAVDKYLAFKVAEREEKRIRHQETMARLDRIAECLEKITKNE